LASPFKKNTRVAKCQKVYYNVIGDLYIASDIFYLVNK